MGAHPARGVGMATRKRAKQKPPVTDQPVGGGSPQVWGQEEMGPISCSRGKQMSRQRHRNRKSPGKSSRCERSPSVPEWEREVRFIRNDTFSDTLRHPDQRYARKVRGRTQDGGMERFSQSSVASWLRKWTPTQGAAVLPTIPPSSRAFPQHAGTQGRRNFDGKKLKIMNSYR